MAGVALGAIAGILFAPDKGSKTQKKLVTKGKDYVTAVQEKLDGLMDTISKKYEEQKEVAEETVSNGKTKQA